MSVRILQGDCRDILKTLPSESVQCCVTSPPYFGLRDYGVAGQIGLEPTPDAFATEMVELFREVRRVLRDDGTLWLNIGDSYAGSGRGGGAEGSKQQTNVGSLIPPTNRGSTLSAGFHETARANGVIGRAWVKPPVGLKPKDLIGIPWRVAFALQEDGWWLRGDNVWAKPNGMPESTKDRPTRGHEYVFQFSKSESYYYGYEDVKLPPLPESVERLARSMRGKLDGEQTDFVISGGGYAPPGQPPHQGARKNDKQRGHSRRHAGFNDRWDAMEKAKQMSDGAALRSVWWLSPGGFDEAHFAVMPPELAALLVLAGCPAGGTVLDPFGGAGTTGLVADRLKRNAVLIELNPEYADMARRRIERDAGLFAAVRSEAAE